VIPCLAYACLTPHKPNRLKYYNNTRINIRDRNKKQKHKNRRHVVRFAPFMKNSKEILNYYLVQRPLLSITFFMRFGILSTKFCIIFFGTRSPRVSRGRQGCMGPIDTARAVASKLTISFQLD